MTSIDPMRKVLITTGFCGGLDDLSTFLLKWHSAARGRFGWRCRNVLINLLVCSAAGDGAGILAIFRRSGAR